MQKRQESHETPLKPAGNRERINDKTVHFCQKSEKYAGFNGPLLRQFSAVWSTSSLSSGVISRLSTSETGGCCGNCCTTETSIMHSGEHSAQSSRFSHGETDTLRRGYAGHAQQRDTLRRGHAGHAQPVSRRADPCLPLCRPCYTVVHPIMYYSSPLRKRDSAQSDRASSRRREKTLRRVVPAHPREETRALWCYTVTSIQRSVLGCRYWVQGSMPV